jgi:hypothetical protein
VKPTAIAAVIAAALLLPACGGDDKSSSGGDQLTKDQFVQQANAICKDASTNLAKLTRPSSMSGLKAYAAEALPLAQQLQSKLKGLNPPSNLKSGFDDALTDLDGGVTQIAALRDAASSGDLNKVKDVALKLKASKFGSKAAQLGLTECGSSVSTG